MYGFNKIQGLKNLIMKPVLYNDLHITLLDVLPALHSEDWTVESHFHPWYEFNYVASGAVYTTINGCEFPVKKGQFYVIPPGVTHSHRNFDRTGDDGFCLRWQLSKAETVAEHIKTADDIISTLSIPNPSAHDANIKHLFQNENYNLIYAQSLLVDIISLIYNCFAQSVVVTETRNPKNERIVNQALLYLSQYYPLDISAKDVAISLHLSYRHLARIFKEVTGLSIVKKLNDIRINEAKRLLVETNLPILEIAREVGYENEYYFSNTFKQYSLIPPSEFRKLNK